MTRLLAPDKQCVGVDIGRARYQGNRLNVTNPTHAAMLKEVGYFDPGPGGVARASGYRCPACGHGSWFRICGKCGAEATREDPST